ncbi:MAG: imelysin family protein [Hahellaceae bacterium]|nr:imelysin family protein [Hahellaceae bacterium]MCP5212777.1 imelysin family protein [Hahellaceae bacterium]
MQLHTLTASFCETPTQNSFNDLQGAWKQAMHTWSALAAINFGPIDETEALWRFQFWPDPINLVQRKFISRLSGANKDNSPNQLAQASTAIQGLSAIEFLLFDPSISLSDYQSKTHFCTILVGTAANLATNASLLNKAWQQEYPVRWLDKKNPEDYTRNIESLFSGMVMALDTIKSQKLGTPLGFKKGESALPVGAKPNPWQVESWRSQTSISHILATMQFCQELYEMEFGFRWYLFTKAPTADAEILDKKISDLFAATNQRAAALDKSIFVLLQNNDTNYLLQLHTDVELLLQLLRNNYAKAAGIQFRFNAKDGD